VRTQIVVAQTQMPEASVHGTFVLPAGVGVDELRITIMRAASAANLSLDPNSQVQGAVDPSGHFVFEDLPAGTYHFMALRTEGEPRGVFGMRFGIEVASAANVDLGTIELGVATVRFRVALPDGTPVGGLGVRLAPAGSPNFGFWPLSDELGFVEMSGIPAGSHKALVWGENMAPVITPITVGVGQILEAPIIAETAIPTTFRFVGLPVGVPFVKLAVIRAGATIASEVVQGVENVAAPCVRGLSPGNYRIEVTSEVDSRPMRGATEFTVGTKPGDPVEVHLAR
jgi:hypothetical protein